MFLDLASAWADLLVRDSLLVIPVFVFVVIMARCGRRIGPAFHVAMWSLIFLRLLLPPGLNHPLSAGRLLGAVSVSNFSVGAHQVEAPPNGALAATGGGEAFLIGPSGASQNRAVGIFIVWVVGALTTFSVYRRRKTAFSTILRAAVEVKDPEIDALAASWRDRLRIRRRVRVLSSNARTSPFTTGVIRPVIFLPQSVLADSSCLEPVIAHEMAHVARLDALWLGLQHLIHSVYFFHPLVWISGARLSEEREQLADATAVAAGRLAARDYVGGLLNVLRLDLQGAGAPTMSAKKRRIGVRIQKILDREGGRPRVVAAVLGAFVLGVFLLPLGQGGATVAPDDGEQGMQTSSPAQLKNQMTMINPLPDGRVTQTFGPGKRDPFTGKEGVFHRGIDIGAKTGTPVVAPAGGVIRVATEAYEESPAAGTVIIIDHGQGLTTMYSHLGSLAVDAGQRVSQREVIATVGSTGKSTGPHLHFEVRDDGENRNPADFVEDWKR